MSKLLASLSCLFALVAWATAGDTLYGTIVEVKSANLVVLDYGNGKYTVRLIGIELAKDKALAKKAQQLTADMILNKNVQMRFGYRNSKGEMMSRILTVYTDSEEGEDLGEKLVGAGLAKKNPGFDYPCGCLAKAEGEAKAAKLGIWAKGGAK